MKKIYIAAPLFSQIEREFNERVDNFVKDLGYTTYLPQRDGGVLTELIKGGMSMLNARKYLFEKDWDAVKWCDIVLVILDGRVPDEGACVEIGMGYALGKECIAYKTDLRSFISGEDNLMISGVIQNRIAKDFSGLQTLLEALPV